jgi:MOSC domain-containing protein YiiM
MAFADRSCSFEQDVQEISRFSCMLFLSLRFLVSGRSGFYFFVIEPGDVAAGSKVEILDRDPDGVTVSDILRLYLGQRRDPELLQRATNVGSLPENWKTQLLQRAQDRV